MAPSRQKNTLVGGLVMLVAMFLTLACFPRSVSADDNIEEIKNKAEQGDVWAQHRLGSMYDSGEGVPQDYKQGIFWTKKAAEQGDVGACFTLGLEYAVGKSVPQDFKKAFKWHKKAAEQGFTPAQFEVGELYANGQGVPQNDKKAFEWFKKVAEQGYANGQRKIGLMYALGQGVLQNNVNAYAWLSLAAAQDDALAIKGRELVSRQCTPDQRRKSQALAVEIQAKIDSKNPKLPDELQDRMDQMAEDSLYRLGIKK